MDQVSPLTMATNFHFVPGRNKDSEIPVLDGFRYCKDKKKDKTTYWKCSQFRKGCRARIITADNHLLSPVPEHNHEVQNAETAIHVAKQTLKRKAAEGDHPTKYLVAEAVAGMGIESRAKLSCQLSSLSRMAQRSRQAANRHPSNRNPSDLENLSIPQLVPEHVPETAPKLVPDAVLEAASKQRRTKRTPVACKQRLLERKLSEFCCAGLVVRTTSERGRGVFTTTEFETGDFLVEYTGELITGPEATKREAQLTTDQGCFLLFFTFLGISYCLDATKEDGTLGRLVNHGRRAAANCILKLVDVDGLPRIYLKAARDISPGEELRWDYGDRRKDVLADNEWLR